MTTSPKFDSDMFGAMAIESSSVNVSGRSFTLFRRMASGIFGPCAGAGENEDDVVG